MICINALSNGKELSLNKPILPLACMISPISTLGWFNVDVLVEGYPGTTYAPLDVQLQTNADHKMHVYLFCLKRKMLSVAYDHTGNNYRFDKINGKVPLFLNDDGNILAFGSYYDKMFYGTGCI